ncbi:unnamed protein product [Didymodactylos carnosus]|uniref:ABC transporter domain-containing protein n=1 Tax=Didymodactylos carnosus TaxID=1234261 RepID=A0A8S2H0U8_9BILA|nr:unnamed protein product [Didymodactylos carnosus]CAF3587337.1 unnamed protein product [Didymodactylos carnosus]
MISDNTSPSQQSEPNNDGQYPLVIRNLIKHYRGRSAPAVDNVSFKVHPGEFHAFIGANGAGKTTTIKSIIGAYTKYKGEILVYGHVNSSLAAKRFLGYVPEIARFPPRISLFRFLLTMSILSGMSFKEGRIRVEEVIAQQGLSALKTKSPNSFSSGQKKKVLLSQALLHNPKVIVMDEPAANLDPRARLDFFDTLKDLQKGGVAIIISSHILSEVGKYATGVSIIDGGKIVLTGTIDEIKKNMAISYEVQTNDQKALEKLLNSRHISFTFTEQQRIKFDLTSDEEMKPIQQEIAQSGLIITYIARTGGDLEELYRKYVLKGSVDTMSEPIMSAKARKKLERQMNHA